jgi:hypothetical protein
MENKQTAVEWFAERIQSDKIFNFQNVLKQAKEMEEDQHCTTWYKSIANDRRELHEPSINFKQYYNKTYGK